MSTQKERAELDVCRLPCTMSQLIRLTPSDRIVMVMRSIAELMG
jgi:hypothetical protein